MKKYILVTPLLLLGCATADNAMRNKPDLVFRSAKDAPTVATCIAEQWKTYTPPDGGSVPVTLRQRLGSYELTVACGSGNCKVAEVTSMPDNQSNTAMYTIAIGEGRYLSAVDYCQ